MSASASLLSFSRLSMALNLEEIWPMSASASLFAPNCLSTRSSFELRFWSAVS